MKAPLDDIKAGDFLFIVKHGWPSREAKTEVTRTTPTRVWCGDAAYTRGGDRVGQTSSFHREWAEKWDDAKHSSRLAAAQLRQDCERLKAFRWDVCSPEQVAAAIALVDSWRKP